MKVVTQNCLELRLWKRQSASGKWDIIRGTSEIGRGSAKNGRVDLSQDLVTERAEAEYWAELMGSLKLNNVWIVVQLIFCPRWPMNQLNKNPNVSLTWDFLSALVLRVVGWSLPDGKFEFQGSMRGELEESSVGEMREEETEHQHNFMEAATSKTRIPRNLIKNFRLWQPRRLIWWKNMAAEHKLKVGPQTRFSPANELGDGVVVCCPLWWAATVSTSYLLPEQAHATHTEKHNKSNIAIEWMKNAVSWSMG